MQAQHDQVIGSINTSKCEGIENESSNEEEYGRIFLMFSNKSTKGAISKFD